MSPDVKIVWDYYMLQVAIRTDEDCEFATGERLEKARKLRGELLDKMRAEMKELGWKES